MNENVVKELLLEAVGSHEDQIDHAPYNKFAELLVEKILNDANEVWKDNGTALGVINTIKIKYLRT